MSVTSVVSITNSNGEFGDTGEMCSVYSKTKTSIHNMLNNEEEINIDVFRNIFQLIKNDWNSPDEKVKNSAMDMLDFIVEADIKNEQLRRELKKVAQGSNKEISSFLITAFTVKIEETMADSAMSLNLIEELSDWDNKHLEKVIDTIVTTSDELKPEMAKKFLIDKIIPTMYNLNVKDDVRGALIELGFKFLTKISIDDILPGQVDIFLKNVINCFVKNLSELREKEYPEWHRLWIFLIRFCGKKVHTSMELANKLLRLVEYAFRNNSYQQRLLGYDCWKEFIDNASLDMTHMCSPKQIKLLITPLKAKFSKLAVVISKRFDIFVYLLEKLQDRSVLCLPLFLEFCFGPLDNDKTASSNKGAQAKCVSQLRGKCAAVLLAIIGHSHFDNEQCTELQDIIQFRKPVITSENIPSFIKIILQSLKEVYILLKEWCSENQKLEIIKCSWGTILQHVSNNNSQENIKKCFNCLVEFLESIAKQSDDDNLINIFIMIIYVTICHQETELLDMLGIPIVECVLQILLTKPLKDDIAVKITQFMYKKFQSNDKKKFMECFLIVLSKFSCLHNFQHVQKIWLMLELNDDFKEINLDSDIFIKFLMFGVYHLHSFEVVRPFLYNWAKFYIYLEQIGSSEATKLKILQEIEVFFTNNPLHFSNIISFLNVISQFESSPGQEKYVSKLLKVCCMLLSHPDLAEGDVKKLCSVVITLLDWTLPFYNTEDNENIVENTCNCVKNLLVMHKCYNIFGQSLESCLKQLSVELKAKFLEHLLPTLKEVSENENKKVSTDCNKILQILQPKEKKQSTEKTNSLPETSNKTPATPTFTVPQSRASRIANMSRDKNSTPTKAAEKNNEQNNIFKLFGKSPAKNNTPIKIKGSMLNNVSPKSNSPKRAKKIMKALSKKEMIPAPPPLEEDNTADFVQINTVVKIQPDKLNDHQKEMMKKRREDIPALYQDLSQSQSQDIFKMKENSNSNSLIIAPPKVEIKPSKDDKVTNTNSTNVDNDNQSKVKESDKLENCSTVSMENDESSSTKDVPEINKVEEKIDDDTIKIQKNNVIDAPLSDASEENEEKIKKKRRVELELARLQMDLVGGNKFVPTVTAKRTRSVVVKEKVNLRPRKEKTTPKPSGKSRMSLPAKVSSPKTEPKSNVEKSRISLAALKENTPKRFSFPDLLKTKPDEQETTQNSQQDISNVKPRGRKRKLKKESPESKQQKEEHSEDIIESSQESFVNISSSPKRVKKTPQKQTKTDIVCKLLEKTESKQEEIQTQADIVCKLLEKPESKQEIIQNETDIVCKLLEKPESKEEVIQNEIEIVNTEEPDIIKIIIGKSDINETQTDTETCSSTIKEDISFIVGVQTAKKPELTDSEKEICQMDTASLLTNDNNHIPEESHNKFIEVLSEISVLQEDNKNIENEDTEIISHVDPCGTPIVLKQRSSLPTSPVNGDTPVKTNELLTDTMNISPIGSVINSEDETEIVHPEEAHLVNNTDINTNAATIKEPELLPPSPPLLVDIKAVQEVNVAVSESTTRSNKLLNMVRTDVPVITNKHITKRRIKGLQMSPSAGRIKKLMSNFSAAANNSEKEDFKIESQDVLTFSRDVPSPLATPGSSILKRKLAEAAGDETPPAKRKRVNFSDPTTTSKKVFIKYKDEFLSEKNLSAKVLFNGNLGEDEEDDVQPIDDTSPTKNGDEPCQENIELKTQEENCANTELTPATEESMKLENATLFDAKRPIYPNLVDCDDDILPILKKVTSPLFVTSLMKDLQKKNVKTVGDIAKLSEAEVNRLPFKSPPVEVVFKALDAYYEKKQNVTSPSNNLVVNNVDVISTPKTNKTARSPKRNTPNLPKVLPEVKLEDVMKWFENATVTDLDAVFKNLLAKPNTSTVLKSNNLYDKKELNNLVACEMQKAGLQKTVQLINNAEESTLEANTEEQCLTELKSCIDKLLSSSHISKSKLVQTCFEPLIKNYQDVSGCLEKFSEELKNKVFNRIQENEIPELIERLKLVCGENVIANCLDKEEIIKTCSLETVFKALCSNESDSNETINILFKECLTRVDDELVLSDMYRFISSKLSTKILAQLHIEFINRITNKTSD